MQNVEVKTETIVTTTCDLCGGTVPPRWTGTTMAGSVTTKNGEVINYGLSLVLSKFSNLSCHDVCGSCLKDILDSIRSSIVE
jgi:hypothetical protein